MLPLPWFVVRFLERRLGLRTLVRLTCIDILLTLESVHPDHIAQAIKRKKMRQMTIHSLRLVVGEYTATTSYYFLLLPITSYYS